MTFQRASFKLRTTSTIKLLLVLLATVKVQLIVTPAMTINDNAYVSICALNFTFNNRCI